MTDPTLAASITRAFETQARGSACRATADQRRDRLRRLRAAIEAHFPEVVAALAADLGKPPFDRLARSMDGAGRRAAQRPCRAGRQRHDHP
jgi:acyl-CoA reductase-like NAD-dependent aldehyde dehydrogenase